MQSYYGLVRRGLVPFICSPEDKSGMLHCSDIPPDKKNGTYCTISHPKEVLPSNLSDPLYNDCVDWNNFCNVCRESNENPYLGAINFDNIGSAWITMFQVNS